MKIILEAVKTLLAGHASLTYAHDSGYVAEDVWELVEKNRFPFFNVVPVRHTVEKIDKGISISRLERHVYTIKIEFATHSLSKNIAILGDSSNIGLLDFHNDIWTALKSDRTLDGVVNGLTVGYVFDMDVITPEEGERYYMAGGEMTIQYYKDIVA